MSRDSYGCLFQFCKEINQCLITWGLLLTVLAIWPNAMTSSFLHQKTTWEYIDGFSYAFPHARVALWEERGSHCDPMGRRGQACAILNTLCGFRIHAKGPTRNAHWTESAKLHSIMNNYRVSSLNLKVFPKPPLHCQNTVRESEGSHQEVSSNPTLSPRDLRKPSSISNILLP